MAEIKKISTELQLLNKFLDTSGDAGTSGQLLSSTAILNVSLALVFRSKFAPCEHFPTLPPAFILGPNT